MTEIIKTGAIIVNIARKIPLFKGTEEANKVELVYLENLEFPVVVEKDLYKIGEEVVFIYPDYCVKDIPLFQEYIRPDGDISKSKLGKIDGFPQRIRAKKFNLHTGNGNPVYSYGIILPSIEIKKEISLTEDYLQEIAKISLSFVFLNNEAFLDEFLGLFKYESQEEIASDNLKYSSTNNLPFPENLYKTDEENIFNLLHLIEFPITLIGTQKIDGSSITIGVTPSYPEGFICSRKQRKKLVIKKVTGIKHLFSNPKLNWIENIIDFIFENLLKIKRDKFIYEEKENDDPFVKAGLPYLKDLLGFKTNLILRGELNGKNMKGSGNKNNPSSREEINIKFFDIDIEKGNKTYEKLQYDSFKEEIADLYLNSFLEYKICPLLFEKTFYSKEELLETCEEIFKQEEETHDIFMEGIVVKDPVTNFSAKVMNLKYDSKK